MAMSGGLDSSVAAILLQEQGYEVIGVTMKLWQPSCLSEASCSTADAINDARMLAQKLGIEHHVIDYTREFQQIVIHNFIQEYLHAHTPNPCILCNIHLKWAALLHQAELLHCDMMATGHYAMIKQENGRYYVSKAKDDTKDQSYVLWGLSQENLAKTTFPLSGYTKQEIRQMAHDMGHETIANEKESYDICFIPDNDYRSFLQAHVDNIDQICPPGNILDTTGKIVGRHKGFPFYTIGQRKGLKLAFGEPRYVCKIDAQANEITLGKKEDLLQKEVTVSQLNFGKYSHIPPHYSGWVKIRYRDRGQQAYVEQQNDKLHLIFPDYASAVTPGQSAVIYEGNDVVAGGIIE